MIFNTRPRPKPRMTRADAWRKRECVLDYYSFKDEIKLQARDYVLPCAFRVVFGVPFPRSYNASKREKLLGTPHQSKPDIDNYLKAIMDVLSDNDSYIWKVEASKIWTSGDGFIQIDSLEDENN